MDSFRKGHSRSAWGGGGLQSGLHMCSNFTKVKATQRVLSLGNLCQRFSVWFSFLFRNSARCTVLWFPSSPLTLLLPASLSLHARNGNQSPSLYMSWQVGRATLIRCTISLSFEDKITITGKCTLYSNVALSNLTNTFLWQCLGIDPALTGRLWVSYRSENQITAVCESLFLCFYSVLIDNSHVTTTGHTNTLQLVLMWFDCGSFCSFI